MKQPFTFPTYEEWLKECVEQKENVLKDCTSRHWESKKAYALFYLLALRDWVNEGWELNLDTDDVVLAIGFCTVMKEWVLEYDIMIQEQGVMLSSFYFKGEIQAEQFLSHKDEHTSAIEQLNILYDIK